VEGKCKDQEAKLKELFCKKAATPLVFWHHMLLMPYTPFQHTYAFPFHRTDRRNTRKFIQKRRGKVWVVKKVSLSLSPRHIFPFLLSNAHTQFFRTYIHT
jgi:hypothetical protein